MQTSTTSNTMLAPPSGKSNVEVVTSSALLDQCQQQERSSLYNVQLPFPFKLYSMLEDVAAQGLNDVVSWLPNGQAFRVHQPKEFANDIMTRYFKQSQYKSFQRQLHLYGFHRIISKEKPDEFGAYYHELFKRGQSEQVIMRIPRKKREKKTTNHDVGNDVKDANEKHNSVGGPDVKSYNFEHTNNDSHCQSNRLSSSETSSLLFDNSNDYRLNHNGVGQDHFGTNSSSSNNPDGVSYCVQPNQVRMVSFKHHGNKGHKLPPKKRFSLLGGIGDNFEGKKFFSVVNDGQQPPSSNARTRTSNRYQTCPDFHHQKSPDNASHPMDMDTSAYNSMRNHSFLNTSTNCPIPSTNNIVMRRQQPQKQDRFQHFTMRLSMNGSLPTTSCPNLLTNRIQD